VSGLSVLLPADKEIQDDGEDDADQDRGDNGDEDSSVAALEEDIARQAAQAIEARNLRGDHQQEPGRRQHEADDDEEPPYAGQVNHVFRYSVIWSSMPVAMPKMIMKSAASAMMTNTNTTNVIALCRIAASQPGIPINLSHTTIRNWTKYRDKKAPDREIPIRRLRN
jgi:hypothetical protein